MTLNEIANKHKTDKGSWHHGYAAIYDTYFTPLRGLPIRLAEIGIGGYHYPDRGGESLKMWDEYFTKAEIIGVDIHVKLGLDNDRVQTYVCNQTDERLQKITGVCDIIIDDASHINNLTIATFELLWPMVAVGGFYVVEDTETSYWEVASDGTDFKGGSHPDTVMNYFKAKTDLLNLTESDIEFIHFYKGLIILKKK